MGVRKGQTVGVKCLPADKFHIGIVQVVSDEGMSDIFHMNTDLMGTACLQDKRDKAVPAFFFCDTIMGHGSLSVFKVDLPFNERTAGPADGRVDRAGRGSNAAADNSQIFSLNVVARGHAG